MSDTAQPPGHVLNLALIERLNDIVSETASQREALKAINDPGLKALRDPLDTILDTGARVLGTHGETPGADVAQELAGLLSLIRAVKLPVRDPKSGEKSFNLDLLRGAQGRMVMALSDALDAARAVGLVPPEPVLPGGLPAEVPRSGNEDLLHDIAISLDRVSEQLTALEAAKADPSSINQQTGLIEFYLGAMRVQIDLARLQLRIGERTIDFAALSRASQTMAELTGDFFATVKAWAGRIAARVSGIATAVNRAVASVARRISRVARISANALTGNEPQPAPRFSVWERPLRQVSGDFLVIKEIGRRIAFIVGDVSGRDSYANTLKSQFVRMINNYFILDAESDVSTRRASYGSISAGSVTKYLNDHFEINFASRIKRNRHGADLLACVLSEDKRSLTYVDAGIPLLIVDAQKKVRVVGKMNVWSDKHFSLEGNLIPRAEVRLDITGAWFIIAVTDGVSEQMGSGRADDPTFGLSGVTRAIQEVLQSEPAVDAGVIVNAVGSSLLKYAGSAPQTDDQLVAALMLRA